MAHVLPTGIHLIWTDNSLDEIHFMVQRKEGAGEFAEHLATSAPDVNMIMDEMVVDAGVYTYRVRAMSAAGLSAFSNEIQATASIPDAETSGTGGDTGSGGDTVTGAESGTADGTDATTTQSESGGDTTADADTGASSDDTGADEIAAPSDLVLHNLPSAFHMVWADNSDNETNFVIERKVGAGPYEVRTTLPANTTAFHEAEVVSGTTYTYRIMATGADGQMSPYSEEVEQTAT